VPVASTLKEEVPAAVGVPEISPVCELRVRPAGRRPDETDHVYTAQAPVAASVD